MSSKTFLRSARKSNLWNRLRVLVIVVGVASSVQSRAIAQSVTTDGTVGSPQTLTGPNYTIPQAAGQTAGSNLFHSFGRFNLNAGESATFLSNPTIRNIFSRVTGGDSSLINGTLATQGQNVNLFFINPNGIVFGPNAQLNVTGSFLATTADRIVFADGTQFSATSPRQSSVLTVSVPVGLQFGTRPGSILVRGGGSTIDGTATSTLAAGENQTLALIGGDVILQGGTLETRGGQISVGSVGNSTLVGLNTAGQSWTFDYSDVLNFGDIQLDGQSTIVARDARLEGVQIHTGSIAIRGGGAILSQGRAGNIAINAKDKVELVGGDQLQSRILSGKNANDDPVGGNIQINTRSLSLTGGAAIGALASRNTSGAITINSSDSVLVDGEGRIRSQIYTNVSDGSAGNINIQTGTLQVKAGGVVFSEVVGNQEAAAGTITINARDVVQVDGANQNGLISLISSASRFNLSKPPGDIQIKTGSLSVTNGAEIYTSSSGQSNKGDIVIQARDRVTVSGSSDRRREIRTGSFTFPSSGIASESLDSEDVGNAGNIQITAQDVDVNAGGVISATSFGQGNAGNIKINTQRLTRIDGEKREPNGSFRSSQVSSGAAFSNTGQAGNISIRTTDLQISNGAFLSVDTLGQGRAGDVLITAQNQVILTGIGEDVGINTASSRISSNNFLGTNSGGTIQIDTGSLRVEKGARILSSTLGIGNAGKIIVNARDSIALDESNPITGGSSIVSGVAVLASQARPEVEQTYRERGIDAPVFDEGVGAGGDIQLNTRSLSIANGALISATSTGQGPAGNVTIRVSDTLSANNGTIANSSLKTSGGRVSIQAGSVRLSGNSNIQTEVARGEGSGGDITITANSITALDDSNILAFAQEGQGGNITLNTRAFFGQNYASAASGALQEDLIRNGRVDINASGAISGIITLPETSFIQNELTALPDVPVNTETLLANSCIRRDRASGTFYVTGSGNLPSRPRDMPYSTYETAEVRSTTPQAWKPGDAIVEPQGVYTLANGKRVISRLCVGERSS
jgi:filamentous hemagglutinin family protein